ncbi:MAG: tetratricopeptide repeat protein [Opitutaceae bacterium]|nr:tetratricopeptide repeat protein [Opitutaceae bacterium]
MAKPRSSGSRSPQPQRGALPNVAAGAGVQAGLPAQSQAEVGSAPSSEPADRVEGNAVHLPGRITRRPVWLGALLFLVVAAVFLPSLRHDFITYDDPGYVTANAQVQAGLTWENVKWAFASVEVSNWHPLTWLSHMLDCQLFGLQPWGHHLTNLLLHACNTLLLFVVLRRATGAVGRSLFVAALFGLHPLHVESVAWIAERKDVLSTLFWMLTLWAYVVWVQHRAAERPRAWVFYGLAFLSLAAGLMAKPMLVTLPCVLLLLDGWPLGRWAEASVSRRCFLVVEKLPFFVLSAVSCVITYFAQQQGGAVKTLEDFTLLERAANALLAYCQYLGKCFWPTRLAVLYPNFGQLPPWWQTALAGALLAAISIVAMVLWQRRRPAVAVGWFWFLGTLVPVIGLVQVGGATMADRYSYVPLVGIFIAAVWAVADLPERLPQRRAVLGAVAGAVVLTCGVLTSRQLSLWRDSVNLFRHTVAVTENNWMAYYNLSLAYGKSARTADEAKEAFRRMVDIIAGLAERHHRRGLALAQSPDRQPEAIAALEKALRVKGDAAETRNDLGLVLARTPGRLLEAIAQFQAALHYRPDFPEAQYNLGNALVQLPERRNEAIAALRLAVWGRPDWAEAHCAFAAAMASDPSRRASAIAEYEMALRLQPDMERARTGLAQLQAAGP